MAESMYEPNWMPPDPRKMVILYQMSHTNSQFTIYILESSIIVFQFLAIFSNIHQEVTCQHDELRVR